MQTAPGNLCPHIGIFGRRNVGKSSILNILAGQEVAIVSDTPGTTTDPVTKAFELPPLGAVRFIDTAGIDDEGALGELRTARTAEIFARVDLALLVAAAGVWETPEENLLAQLKKYQIPVIVVFNKGEIARPAEKLLRDFVAREVPAVVVSARENTGFAELRNALLQAAPAGVINQERLVADLLPPGGTAVLVIPIDSEAPQGRLILPQVMTLRNLLDYNHLSMVTTVKTLPQALAGLRVAPDLVVTDSQAFGEVAKIVPENVPLTGFSVLFARCMGDLPTQAAGTRQIRALRPGDEVLIAEACSHHPGGDDIGRVKIPRLLQKKVGGTLRFTHVQGHDFPTDLSPFRLVIMCGGCMNNRREILSRIMRCREQGVAVSNYGLAIAECLGIFERALKPFAKIM